MFALVNSATHDFLAVEAHVFDIHDPLRWVECASDIRPESHTWDGTNFQTKPVETIPPRYCVLKTTIRRRLRAAGLETTADTARASLTEAQQAEWADAVVIYSDDTQVRGFLTGIGADPTTILAYDADATSMFGKLL